MLTVLAAWGLRKKYPDLPRAFRVPGGNIGLWVVIILPLTMTLVMLRYSDPFAQKYGAVGLALGLVVYAALLPFRMKAGTLPTK